MNCGAAILDQHGDGSGDAVIHDHLDHEFGSVAEAIAIKSSLMMIGQQQQQQQQPKSNHPNNHKQQNHQQQHQQQQHQDVSIEDASVADWRTLPLPPYHSFYKSATYQYGKAHQGAKEFTDMRQMENTLHWLLNDFNSGKLQAFGEKVTFENMIKIREQQENLARLHFELNAQQSSKRCANEIDVFFDTDSSSASKSPVRATPPPMSKPFSKSNMLKLIQNLQNLCKSIDRLQLKNSNELEFN